MPEARACRLRFGSRLAISPFNLRGFGQAFRNLLMDTSRHWKTRLCQPNPGSSLSCASVQMPTVTIVIPVYNGGGYILEAVESVLHQDYEALELIVVDDGSTDDTVDKVRSFGGGIRLIQQTNAGQSSALNNGWAASRGELLGYLSADDRLRPGGVALVATALADARDAVLAYPDFGLINERSELTGVVRTPDYSMDRLYADLHCLPGPGALFRRSSYDRAGGWDPLFRQIPDLEFFLRMALQGRFLQVPQIAADFRIHGGSATYRAVSAERADEPIKMVQKFFTLPDIPAEMISWKARMMANADLLSAMLHGQSYRFGASAGKFSEAFKADPSATILCKSMTYILEIIRLGIWRFVGRA